MPNKSPSISVVIPCYNAAPYLRETLDSVLKQTYPALEVLFIDDGSTDDSGAIAASYGPSVRVIRQENRGESVARNRGLDEARGDWVALLDADDVWEADKLQKQAAVIREAGEDVVCVYSDFYRFQGSQRSDVVLIPEFHAMPNYHVLMLCYWCVITSAAIFRADLARQVRFPEHTRASEDIFFFLELRHRGRFTRVPEALAGYRSAAGQQTKSVRHKLESVKVRYHYLLRNSHLYKEAETREARAMLAEQLVLFHDVAYWKRENDVVRAYRAAYREIHPDPEQPLPASLARPVYPAWLVGIKDRLDWALARGGRSNSTLRG